MNHQPSTCQLEALASVLQQATSQNQQARTLALRSLEQAKCNQIDQLMRGMVELLKSTQFNIHVLAYSYILNEIIYKNKRADVMLVQKLENAFNEILFTPCNNGNMLRTGSQKVLENVVSLAVGSLSRPNSQRQITSFFKENVPKIGQNIYSHKQFMKRLLINLADKLPSNERKKLIQLNVLISNQIFELFYTNKLEDIELAINLSYFLFLFPEDFWNNLIKYLNQQNAPEHLLIQIIKRINIALNVDFHRPSAEKCLCIYLSVKEKAVNIRVRDQDNTLFAATNIILRTLSEICNIGQITTKEAMIIGRVFNIDEFHSLISWLLNICTVTEYEDESEQMLNGAIIQIISKVSEKMSEEVLEQYFRTIFENKSQIEEEKLLFLLSGASKNILDLFNSEIIIQKIMQQLLAQSSLDKNYEKIKPVVFSFIENYVKKYQIIDQKQFLLIQKYVLFLLDECQMKLRRKNTSEKDAIEQMTRVSHLLCIYMAMAKYPREQFCTYMTIDKYSYFISESVLRYLVTFLQQLPDTSHEKLFESFAELSSKKYLTKQLRVDKSIICSITMKVYSEFLSIQQSVSLDTIRSISKARQQLLTIIKNSLDVRLVMSEPDQMDKLRRILVTFDPQDKVIAKQILFVMRDFMMIYNLVTRMGIQMNMEFGTDISLDKQLSFVNFDLISVIEDIFFSQKLQEFEMLLTSNISYDFIGNIDTLLSEFYDALKVIVELSLYKYCFNFVEHLTLRLINYIEQSLNTIQNLCVLAKRKTTIPYSFEKLKRLPIFLDCLVQTLYLNPRWIDPSYMTQAKHEILQTKTFLKCKERIDEYVSGDITRMLAQISIQSSEDQVKNIDRWDKAYFDFLQCSGVGDFCEIWISQLKKQNDL